MARRLATQNPSCAIANHRKINFPIVSARAAAGAIASEYMQISFRQTGGLNAFAYGASDSIASPGTQ